MLKDINLFVYNLERWKELILLWEYQEGLHYLKIAGLWTSVNFSKKYATRDDGDYFLNDSSQMDIYLNVCSSDLRLFEINIEREYYKALWYIWIKDYSEAYKLSLQIIDFLSSEKWNKVNKEGILWIIDLYNTENSNLMKISYIQSLQQRIFRESAYFEEVEKLCEEHKLSLDKITYLPWPWFYLNEMHINKAIKSIESFLEMEKEMEKEEQNRRDEEWVESYDGPPDWYSQENNTDWDDAPSRVL